MFEEIEDNSNTSLLDGLVISNRYEVIRCLGSGAMGSVHLARDRLLSGNVVALKVLKREIADDQNVRQRFLQEVKLMHRVNHPNVIRTYDVGVDHDLIYFTMEYVTGTSLAELISTGGLDLELFLDISLQICAGLGQIHAADIIHRDLKPANVMLSEGKVKIADFGVARSSRSELTQHKEIIGSTPYIAPEIWMGSKLTKVADFYSLGAIFFELLIGRPPFEHDIPATIMWMHLKKSPEDPKSLRNDIPEWLNALILRMLAKSPENRPSSAEEIYNYILKRSKPSSNKQEDNEIGRIHFVNLGAKVISNLASNIEEEVAAVATNDSDLFVLASSPKSFDKTSYSGIAIREYVSNAFDHLGVISAKSMSTALSAANEILLTKRKDNPTVTGIASSLIAVAIAQNEIYLSFAGGCHAFTYGAEGLKKISDGYQQSANWNLGTSLPLSLDTYKIHYSTGQQIRILLCSPALLETLGRSELEDILSEEDLELCLETLVESCVERKSHFSSAIMLVETVKTGSASVSKGQVMMTIYNSEPRSRGMQFKDYRAFLITDELDKTYKPLIFDEIEKPQIVSYQEPKESSIYSNSPSTEQIIKDQETLSQFSSQRIKKLEIESVSKVRTQEEIIAKKQNKTLLILLSVASVLLLLVVFFVAKLFNAKPAQLSNVSQTVKIENNNLEAVAKINKLLNGVVSKDLLKVGSGAKLYLFKTQQESNSDLNKFQKEIIAKNIDFSEVVTKIDAINHAANKYNVRRYQLEHDIAQLQVQLKVAETSNQNQARTNLVSTQREYHYLSNIVKSLSSSLITAKKEQIFWLELAQTMDQKTIATIAEKFALRKWQDSPNQLEAQKVWQDFSLALKSKDDEVLTQAYANLKKTMFEIVQIYLKSSTEDLLQILLLVEEARFRREVKQSEITFWRKGLKKSIASDFTELKSSLDIKLKELAEIEANYSHNDMLLYRSLMSLDQ